MYPELGRKIIKNIFNRKAAFKGKEKTLSWASSKAVSQKDAISTLFGMEMKSFRELFPEELKTAQSKEKECPIKMGGAGALDLIFYACEFTNATKVVETGVAYGWSSLPPCFPAKKKWNFVQFRHALSGE